MINGTLNMGTGDKLDRSMTKALRAGTVAVIQPRINHFSWTNEETSVQVHGIGPLVITYVNPADDPRKKGSFTPDESCNHEGVTAMLEPLLLRHTAGRTAAFAGALLCFSACTSRTNFINPADLTDFATRYAAAWSSQDPAKLASFYAESGSLTVNAGAPSVGRAAISAIAKGYMTAFPDMVVRLDSLRQDGALTIFHWTWTGTNTGPGGTGKAVHLSGYERWTIGADGLIAESKGHFDEAEYQRQVRSKR